MNRITLKLALASSIALSCGGIATSFASELKPRDTMNEQVADARRETQILTSFSMNPHLHAFDLTVIVDGNKAVLNGKVENRIDKDLAERIAADVDGIKFVDNHIIIEPGYVRPVQVSERGFGEKVEDATISATIKSKLLWNSTTDGLDIHVDTNNGKVTLTGFAHSSGEKDQAGRIAKFTHGVVALDNEIALGAKAETHDGMKSHDEPGEHAMSDTWITSKVKYSLLFTRGVDSVDIAVTTLDGVVSLSGTVDSTAERELAVRVAQDIRGVKKVEAAGLKAG